MHQGGSTASNRGVIGHEGVVRNPRMTPATAVVSNINAVYLTTDGVLHPGTVFQATSLRIVLRLRMKISFFKKLF